MRFRSLIVLGFAGIAAGAAFTVAADNPVLPNPVPETYVVREGDTLWDITEHFYGDPFKWPDIWKRNLETIKDPHWIYPGEVITLEQISRLVEAPAPIAPPLSTPVVKSSAPLRPSAPAPAKQAAPAPTTSADPRRVISTIDKPLPVVTAEQSMRAGFIILRSDIPKSTVLAMENATATVYDTVTIALAEGDRPRPGARYAIGTVEHRVKHPDTGEDLGVVLRVKGVLTIQSVDGSRATGLITNNFDPVERNDLVFPSSAAVGPLYDAWVEPEVKVDGTIIAENEPLLSIHLDDFLYIDRGTDRGVLPGDRFTIYNRNDTRRSEPLGTIQVVSVHPAYAGVIVIRLAENQVVVGDRVVLAERARLLRE